MSVEKLNSLKKNMSQPQSNIKLENMQKPQQNTQPQPKNKITKKDNIKNNKGKIFGIPIIVIISLVTVLAISLLGFGVYSAFYGNESSNQERIPDADLLSGKIKRLENDLELFKDPVIDTSKCVQTADEAIEAKKPVCPKPVEYNYYEAGKFIKDGPIKDYNRVIAVAKNRAIPPIQFVTKDYNEFLASGNPAINQNNEALQRSINSSPFNPEKVKGFQIIPNGMSSIVDIDDKFALTSFVRPANINRRELAVLSKNTDQMSEIVATDVFGNPTKTEIPVREFYLPLESNEYQPIGRIKNSEFKVFEPTMPALAMFGTDNTVYLSDTTGLMYQYKIQFREQLDRKIENIQKAEEALREGRELAQSLASQNPDMKREEINKKVTEEIKNKYSDLEEVDINCAVYFGFQKDDINTNQDIFTFYGMSSAPYNFGNNCDDGYATFGVVDYVKQNQLEKLGTSKITGVELFTYNDQNKNARPIEEHKKHQFNTEIDDGAEVPENKGKTRFEILNPDKTIPNDEEYFQKNPVIIVFGPFGRQIVLAEADYVGDHSTMGLTQN